MVFVENGCALEESVVLLSYSQPVRSISLSELKGFLFIDVKFIELFRCICFYHITCDSYWGKKLQWHILLMLFWPNTSKEHMNLNSINTLLTYIAVSSQSDWNLGKRDLRVNEVIWMLSSCLHFTFKDKHAVLCNGAPALKISHVVFTVR